MKLLEKLKGLTRSEKYKSAPKLQHQVRSFYKGTLRYRGESLDTSENFQKKVLALWSIPDNALVVDAAGGKGENDEYLRSYLYAKKIIGVDLVHQVLTQRTGPAVEAALDVAFPFASSSVDAVLIKDALEHIPHQNFFLQETYRVLKRGGKLLITSQEITKSFFATEEKLAHGKTDLLAQYTFDGTVENYFERLKEAQKTFKGYPTLDTPPYFRIDKEELIRTAYEVGFITDHQSPVPEQWEPPVSQSDWHPGVRMVLAFVKP